VTDSFRAYVEHGWALCAFAPGTKGPEGKEAVGWNSRRRAITAPIEAEAMAQGGLLHAYSGTACLDIDHLAYARPFLAEHGIDIDAMLHAPDSVQIVSGRPNRAKLLYRLPSPLVSKKLCRYESIVDGKKYHAIELRCATRGGLSVQDVLPPSIHPATGQPYQWKYGNDLVGSWRALPELPEALLRLWQGTGADLEEAAPEAATADLIGALPEDAPLEEMAYYLTAIDPDASYDDWLAVGMALHHETGGAPEGLALWDQWSRGGQKYGEAKDGKPAQLPEDKWSSFSLSAHDRTIGTLKRLAAEAGQPPYVAPDAMPVVQEEEFKGPSPSGMPPGPGEDTRPGAIIRRALAPLVFVTSQGSYYDRNRGVLVNRDSIDDLYTPLMPVLHITGNNGGVKTYVPKPRDELRRASWKEVVDGIAMHPGEGTFFEEHGRRYLNTYEAKPIELLQPKDWELDAFHYMWSRPDEKVFRDWLMKFYAHAVQKPGVKIRSAPLTVGYITGSGKSTLMRVVPELLFTPRYVTVMTSEALKEQYNDMLARAWWVHFEEMHSGSNKSERISVFNKVKPWITENVLSVRPMYGSRYDVRNRTQITGASNYEDDALHVDDQDRRWAVGHIADKMTDKDAADLYQFLESERAPGVLRHIFMNESLDGFNPNAPAPDTAAKRVMVRVNYGLWESELLEMIAGGVPPFDKDLLEIKDILPFVKAKGITTLRLSRIVKRAPFNFVEFPSTFGKRLWAWRNVALWGEMSPRYRVDYHAGTGGRPEGHAWSEALPPALAEACDSLG
jgi:hypothetical protein